MDSMSENGPFVLGTVQLGIDYGVANKGGKPSYEAARDIVRTAWTEGVRCFDTARSYGDSELILGRIFQELSISEQVKIQTKWNLTHVSTISESLDLFSETLDRLQLDKIDTLYAHQFESFAAAKPKVLDAIAKLKADGKLANFGVSVYDPSEAMAAIESDLVSVIQIPGNVFDCRFEESGVVAKANSENVTIIVRSLYLQGLLVMAEDQLPARCLFARAAVREWQEFCAMEGYDPAKLAARFVKTKNWGIPLIGCESPEQVAQNALEWKSQEVLPSDLVERCQQCHAAILGREFCDSRRWPQN